MNKIKILLLLLSFIISSSFIIPYPIKIDKDVLYEIGANPNSKPSYRLYYLIETYSDSFCVPKYIAYNVAFKETRYKGPSDTLYNPYLSSKAGAVGAMQIIPKYASYYAGSKVTRKDLMYDLELNVMVSMKILSKNYDKYKSWAKACGAYNTGSPKINNYAKFCVNNIEYTKNWVVTDSLIIQSFLEGF